MFQDALFESNPAASGSPRTPRTLAFSLGLHSALIAALLVIPLFITDAVPRHLLAAALWIPKVREEKRPAVAAPAVRLDRVIPAPEDLIEPREIPSEIARIVDTEPALASAIPAGALTRTIAGLLATSLAEEERLAPPPPAPVTALRAEPAQETVRIGGELQHARLVRQVRPAYPDLARISRVQGVVELEAVIGTDGLIRELRVLSGHPLLVRAAVDAVRQWEYRPTVLNGTPVSVITTVRVTFALGR